MKTPICKTTKDVRRSWQQLAILTLLVLYPLTMSAQNIFSVRGNKTHLNGLEFQVVGLRCSNALLSDATVKDLIDHLDLYESHGINTLSVYFMGSRYSNIYGYEADGTLKETYKTRMAQIIEACDRRGMVVLVGVLYWGSGMRSEENERYNHWTQQEANAAMINTVRWLSDNHYRNVLVDPDNEGMAERGMGFDIDAMTCAGKRVNPDIIIAYNGKGYAPPCADMPVHFGKKTASQPYIESEGTPPQYWGDYSKEEGLDHYINVGIYTEGKKQDQIQSTKKHLDAGDGYMFASTWLQNVPPNYDPGGDGSPCDPGIRWWLEFVRTYRPPDRK